MLRWDPTNARAGVAATPTRVSGPTTTLSPDGEINDETVNVDDRCGMRAVVADAVPANPTSRPDDRGEHGQNPVRPQGKLGWVQIRDRAMRELVAERWLGACLGEGRFRKLGDEGVPKAGVGADAVVEGGDEFPLFGDGGDDVLPAAHRNGHQRPSRPRPPHAPETLAREGRQVGWSGARR